MTGRNLPLDGVVVLDLGQVYQGPYATYLMAKAGAEVIKIEPPDGEPVRRRRAISRGAGVPFAMLNGDKRCITLNLKSTRGQDLLRALAADADVVLENYAPGVMDRLGVGWSALSAINPRLVYASGSGYGLSGPDKDNLAMDVTVQASSGLMSVTGFPDGPPVKAGPALADFLSGVHLYAGVVTALYERVRTGSGRLVEVAMQETIFPTLASNFSFLFDSGVAPVRTGNRHGGLSAAPYNVYPALDGYIAIIGVTEAHWEGLLAAIGRADLIGDPRFVGDAQRVRNIDETDRVVTEWSRRVTRDEGCEILRRHKVPSAPVRDLIEVANDRHMHERGMLEWIEHPEFGRIVVPNSPIRLHGADSLPASPAPGRGEHTAEVLSSRVKMAPEEIAARRRDGVIGP